jgi:hypothetical protein
MNLDIRYPIGYLFFAIGATLVAYGFASGPEIYAEHSLGININIWWGGTMMVFGAVMLVLAKQGSAKK